MNRVEKLHICTQSGWNSVHKTSATQARLNSNMERRRGDELPCTTKELLVTESYYNENQIS